MHVGTAQDREKAAFEAGAQWQREQLVSDAELSEADVNSGEGWYEWSRVPANTTHIAYVHESGEVYDPENGWSPDDFTFAAARGHVHKLVRLDGQSSVKK